ncbi:MAG: TPM domain-containing protein [Planctomycetes bacterium]|nr:TPM domain-containing protein [Planctomycetota bacterium]
MLPLQRRFLVPLLGAVFLAAGRADAVAPQIHDDGKYFSAEALKKANEEIKDISRKYHMDLLVETLATVPGGQADRVRAMSAADRAEFFRRLAVERSQDAVVHGVYVLICRDPRYIYVDVSQGAQFVFDDPTRTRIQTRLIQDFGNRRFDEGLLGVVQLVRERLAALPPPK